MPYNPNIHHRRSIRLKGYDYSQAGLYFVTICCENREHRFGKIENDEMVLNDAGKMIDTQWLALTTRFQNIALHEYIVMPNHFHGILQIVGATLVVAQNNAPKNNVGATLVVAQNDGGDENNIGDENNNRAPTRVAPTDGVGINNGATTRVAPTTKTVGDMMDAFKSITTVEYIRGVKTLGWQRFDGKIWQRNYHEHIIRNEQSYQTISDYIINNPAKWKDDKFYKE
jgi:REP element-mobilizing transposase RayT